MAWVVGELSVGPPSGVDPAGQMRLRIQNKTNKYVHVTFLRVFSTYSATKAVYDIVGATAHFRASIIVLVGDYARDVARFVNHLAVLAVSLSARL